jgi:hypothetical protein
VTGWPAVRGELPAWVPVSAARAHEHPGIVFRPGPTGRRAGLVGGPDIWEVVRAVKSARGTERGLAEDDLLALVAENTGIPVRHIRAAVQYWASYPMTSMQR